VLFPKDFFISNIPPEDKICGKKKEISDHIFFVSRQQFSTSENDTDVIKCQSESDSMPARVSPSGFAVPYHFSISITGGFAFGQKRIFMLLIYSM